MTKSWLTSCLLLGALSAPATAAPDGRPDADLQTPAGGRRLHHARRRQARRLQGRAAQGRCAAAAGSSRTRKAISSAASSTATATITSTSGPITRTASRSTPRSTPPSPASPTSIAGSTPAAANGASMTNKDGRIDSWKVISPEEVSQEILAALINHDFARLQPLLLTEAELKALDLPADQASRIREQLKAAAGEIPGDGRAS